MAPKVPRPETVYVVTQCIWDDNEALEGVQQPEAYKTIAAANAAAKDLLNTAAEKIDEDGDRDCKYLHGEDEDGLYDGALEKKHGEVASQVRVWKVDVSTGKSAPVPKDNGKKVASRPKASASKAPPSDDDDGEDDEDDEEPAKKSAAKNPAAKDAAKAQLSKKVDDSRKKIPQGKPGCLKGLKLLFTGTFNAMDRQTSVATAKTYGAEVISKLQDTDYIILGAAAGPKKIEEINAKNLETITEDEFFRILENGLSKEKRAQVDARREAEAAEAAEGPAKKKAKR